MHHEVSKDDFTLWSLLNHQTSEVFQGLYSSPFLTSYVFDFWLAEKYLKLLGKWSGQNWISWTGSATFGLILYHYTINNYIHGIIFAAHGF